MSYTTHDFEESLERVPELMLTDIDAVIAAWGKGDGQGDDAGHYKWAGDGVTQWAGGFLLRLKDGRFVYITGWCDYTGWGCQDGVVVQYFDREPDLVLSSTSAWDLEPTDLNRWLERSQKEET